MSFLIVFDKTLSLFSKIFLTLVSSFLFFYLKPLHRAFYLSLQVGLKLWSSSETHSGKRTLKKNKLLGTVPVVWKEIWKYVASASSLGVPVKKWCMDHVLRCYVLTLRDSHCLLTVTSKFPFSPALQPCPAKSTFVASSHSFPGPHPLPPVYSTRSRPLFPILLLPPTIYVISLKVSLHRPALPQLSSSR